MSGLEEHIGYWLRALSHAVHHRFEATLRERGVSVAQWVALRKLYDTDAVSLNEAAKLIGIDQSSASRLLDRLVGKGLLVRETDPEDRRAIRIALSPAGRKLVPALAHAADENDRAFFDKVSGEDRQHLLNTLRELMERNKLPFPAE